MGREQYFCVVCGCLATPQEKQILFEANDVEPQVSIHHNCYDNDYQPLSKAEMKISFSSKFSSTAIKHALSIARHAAGPCSIDGDPQEFYLRHEVLAALNKYRELYEDNFVNNDNSKSNAALNGGEKSTSVHKLGYSNEADIQHNNRAQMLDHGSRHRNGVDPNNN